MIEPGTTVFAVDRWGEVIELYVEENGQFASSVFDDQPYAAARVPIESCHLTRAEAEVERCLR